MASHIVSRKAGSANPNWRGGKIEPCDQCKSDVWVKPSKANRCKNHFCNVECRNKWLSENTRGSSGSNWKGGEVDIACGQCGTHFMAFRAEVNRGHGKFCSKACAWASDRASSIDKECATCARIFRVQRHKQDTARFCSYPCAHIGRRKVRTPEEIAMRILNLRITSLMGYSLKGKKAGCKWEQLVGYTLADLSTHLESLFAAGMSWSNIGKWHIDHKTPRAAFSYSSPNDQSFKDCWALSNLQPLWAVDNMRKGARLDWQPDTIAA